MEGCSVESFGESRLVKRLQRGEGDAYRELVERFGGAMLAAARRLLRSEDEARDVFQEACANAFRGISSFREGARLGTWLHRIVVNAALMRLRAAARHRTTSLDALLPSF